VVYRALARREGEATALEPRGDRDADAGFGVGTIGGAEREGSRAGHIGGREKRWPKVVTREREGSGQATGAKHCRRRNGDRCRRVGKTPCRPCAARLAPCVLRTVRSASLALPMS
jgi:hypothetical protein